MDGDQGKAKRSLRVDVHTEASLTFTDGSTVRVIVTDISEGGFRIESEELLEVGEKVRLSDHRHGDVAAEIRWAKGFSAGGVFLTPVPDLD